MPAIYKGSICGSQILDHVLTFAQRNTSMTARDLGFGIVRIQINIGENSTVRIPAANVSVLVVEGELLARRAAAFDYQRRMHGVSGPYRGDRSPLLRYQGGPPFPG